MNYIIKHYKPIFTVIFVSLIVFGISSKVWAVDECGGSAAIDATGEMTYIASIIIHLMSWAWSIPAILSGALMSNELVYGQILGLEHYFFQFWTLMRTIANVGLIAIIVILIGKAMSAGAKAGEIIGKYAISILLSGIFINFSWFIMGALVDVSTIAISGVSQIAYTLMDETGSSSHQDVKNIIANMPDKIIVSKCGCVTSENKSGSSKTWGDLIKKRDSMVGPLIFLGAGIMKIQTYEMNIGCGNTTIGDLGKLTLRGMIQLGFMVMFVVPLIVLAAYNLFRLIYIWGRIIFSPLIVLINLFGSGKDKLFDAPSEIVSATSLSSIVTGLFQPVITTAAMMVGMMLVMGIYGVLNGSQNMDTKLTVSKELQGLSNTNVGSSISIADGQVGSISMIDKAMNGATDTVGGGFGYMLLSLATCFMMWMLVKMSFSFSKGGVGAYMNFDAEKWMGTINNEFMKRVKMPDLGGNTPLEGASLAETMRFMDPETNHLISKIKKSSEQRAKDDVTTASNLLENKFEFLQNNGSLTADEEKTAKAYADTKFSKGWGLPTTQLFKTIKDSAANSDKPNFKADRLGRNTYEVLKTWYEKGGKDAFNKLEFKVNDSDTKEPPIKLGDFDAEMSKKGYLGAYINALKGMDKIEVKEDGKLKLDKKDIIGKQTVGTDIDFKSP